MGKSSGPRTPKGKARASQNAAKHWIESGRILEQEQRDAAILRTGLVESLQPSSLIEYEVIDDLIQNRLIRRRIDIAFTREFSKATLEKAISFLDNEEHSLAHYYQRATDKMGILGADWEKGEPLRPDACAQFLETIRDRIRDRGPQPDDLIALRQIYGNRATGYGASVMNRFLPTMTEPSAEGAAKTTDEEERKKSILEALEYEIGRQKLRAELTTDRDKLEFLSPGQGPLDPMRETFLRYRAANTREFKDLLDSFERIRRLLA